MTKQKYILDLSKETKLLHGYINDIPIEANHRLMISKDDPRIEIGSYEKLIGKLLSLAHTRLDISYSVSALNQFMHSPCRSHFQAALQVLRYHEGTARHGLTFKKTSKLNW